MTNSKYSGKKSDPHARESKNEWAIMMGGKRPKVHLRKRIKTNQTKKTIRTQLRYVLMGGDGKTRKKNESKAAKGGET